MTKSDLIEVIAEKLQLPKGKAESIINCIFDSMEESLKRGQRIEIRGFGSFEIRKYKAYEGRNPRTGDPVGVHPKRLPFFKVGKELKERVNEAAQKGVPLVQSRSQDSNGKAKGARRSKKEPQQAAEPAPAQKPPSAASAS